MLKNEKYMGDLLLQKYYIPDFLTKKVRKNRGELTQYYVENAHAPIVPRGVPPDTGHFASDAKENSQ